jgi:hypothetical protein
MAGKVLTTLTDDLSGQYEKKTWFDQRVLGVMRQRKLLMSQACGKILDVACGTGRGGRTVDAAGATTSGYV